VAKKSHPSSELPRRRDKPAENGPGKGRQIANGAD
jgi:hypothetical protein